MTDLLDKPLVKGVTVGQKQYKNNVNKVET